MLETRPPWPPRRPIRSLGSRVRGAVVLLALAVAGSGALAACGAGAPAASPAVATDPAPSPEASAMTPLPSFPAGFVISSPAFADGSAIPAEFTCRGRDVSPALTWQGVPEGTAALVLFVDDPDARGWVHWIVLDLPGTDGALPRGVAPSAESPRQGRNDFGRAGYGGPCPPSGTHRYRFTLYALAAPLGLPDHPAGPAVRSALEGATILGQTTLLGTFRA